MGNEIMNLQSLKEGLTEKVKTEFGNLIPEEAMAKFVEDTVKEFQEEELPKLAMDVLREHAKGQIKQYLSQTSTGHWDFDNQRQIVNDEMQKIMIDAAPKMFANIIGEMAQRTIQSMAQY